MPPPNPQVVAGDTAVREMQFRSAIALYTQAIETPMLDPGIRLEAYMKRAQAFLQEAEYNSFADTDLAGALTDAIVAGQLAPNWSGAVDVQATIFQRLGAYPEALALFQESYRIDKSDPYWSLISIGETYRMMGDYETALRYYNHVLGRPDVELGMPIYYHRGLTFFRMGQYREAIDSLGEGMRSQRDYAFAYVYRACAFARIGEYSRATADYDVALALWRAGEMQYGRTAAYKTIYERMMAEASSTMTLSRGGPPAVDPMRFCEEYQSYAVHRERSDLLAPVRPDIRSRIADFETVTRN